MPARNFPFCVLLLENDPEECRLFAEALAAVAPCATLSCLTEGGCLLEAVENCFPSLIVVGHRYAGENGADGLKRIRSHPVYQFIPVVLWSRSCAFPPVASLTGR
ncbi:hypothetical protein V9K67_00055 [Paraflavisolibacter sp. H34]|uniref:hypothetical protein n=1 Tax=Huijunlia imazamoxiresistens TaxID=3127457 RepID=UPI0030172F5A